MYFYWKLPLTKKGTEAQTDYGNQFNGKILRASFLSTNNLFFYIQALKNKEKTRF